MKDYFRIGVIANTHALKGEIKVYPTTEDPSRFDTMSNITLTRNEGANVSEYQPERVWHSKGMVVLKLVGVDDIDTALKLKGAEIIVPREDAIPLEEGEYYWSDLIGLSVVTDEGEELGRLDEILTTGANDVYSVSREGAKPILIPAIKQCILDVDTKNSVMKVRLLRGLR